MECRRETNDARMLEEPSAMLRPIDALSGEYELIGRIGVGGMAELLLARLRGMGGFEKLVVLKRIRASRAADPDFIRMFEDEARVAATLEHPNIVTTHDIGRHGDHVFFTMEYLHGETVRSVIGAAKAAREAFPIEFVIQIAIGCAAGLHYAHEHCDYEGRPLGIVHRDVSPSNVIVTRHSGVKLIDFGIARAASGRHITEVGVLKGKAAYMSPEQCRGETVDRRSDVFCLGILLYEMLTGERPFSAGNAVALLGQIVQQMPEPPSRLRPGTPRELDRIVMRALAKDPADRFESAFAVQEALETLTRACGLHVQPGALGRYLAHLFGAKPYPWLPRPELAEPPATPVGGVSPLVATTPPQPADAEIFLSDASIELVTDSQCHAAADPTPSRADMRDAPLTLGASDPASTPRVVDGALPRTATPARAVRVALAGLVAAVAMWAWIDATRTHAADPGSAASEQRAVSRAAAPTKAAAVPVAPAVPGSRGPRVAGAESKQTPVVVALAKSTANLVVVGRAAATPGVLALNDPAADAHTEEETPESTPSFALSASDRRARRRQASRVLRRAQSLAHQDPVRAMMLAQQAVDTYPTWEGYSLLGVAACRNHALRAARRAYGSLGAELRSQLADVCLGHGVALGR